VQAWPKAIVAFPERVTSPAGIVERQLAVVRPGASADHLLAKGLGTERDQGGNRQCECPEGHAALLFEAINLPELTNQGAARSFERFESSCTHQQNQSLMKIC
jgi:hypothetical protein